MWLWLGELSYPLYITHHPLVRLIKNAAIMLHLDSNPVVTFAVCVVGSILAAAVFLLFWDRSIRRYFSLRREREAEKRPATEAAAVGVAVSD